MVLLLRRRPAVGCHTLSLLLWRLLGSRRTSQSQTLQRRQRVLRRAACACIMYLRSLHEVTSSCERPKILRRTAGSQCVREMTPHDVALQCMMASAHRCLAKAQSHAPPPFARTGRTASAEGSLPGYRWPQQPPRRRPPVRPASCRPGSILHSINMCRFLSSSSV